MAMASLTIARTYQRFFDTHPNYTLAVTGGTLNGLGDIVAQISQNALAEDHERRPGWDAARTLRFFCFGFGLKRKFPLRRRRTQRISFKALSKRVAADQLVMAPIGVRSRDCVKVLIFDCIQHTQLVIFVGSMGIMEGRSTSQIREKYADMYSTALLANWRAWPLAQLINFRYMPLPYRIPFQSTCGVFWTLYLSILNAKEDERQDREAAMRQRLR
ncbi:hypothetical protein HYDPIDRAFT_37165 [Hydnomerulius pinastri MD-312]|nr:hypothetical protein HYDPIDRAFT_37165 [Hydnomerulius pinastri MD-312]